MILFTADWHIKLGQKNVPKAWALNRYRMFFKQVHAIQCDTHIIGGDVFDRIPTLEEEALYYEFIRGVKVHTIIFDGNHEATRKNRTFFTTLKDTTHQLNPLVEIIDYSTTIDNKYGILPYADLHRKGSIEQMDSTKPLFTHVRGEIPPHVKPEVDLARFRRFPIIFAGDLHAHSNSQGNIVYPGSPLTTSFHRNRVTTGFIVINEFTWVWDWHEFKLPQLIRKTVSDPAEMVATDYDHTIYELEGDMQELAVVKNSDLLDKKVIKRSSETALILNNAMTISDELAEYLLYILMLDSSKVMNIMGTFHDYVPKY